MFEVNGFDTHAAQGGVDRTHTKCLVEMDEIINNLRDNLQEAYKDTIILTVTEFGRTIKQNGGNGTEHGYGTAIFMAGGLLKKSQVHTDWPGLKKKELFEGRDALKKIKILLEKQLQQIVSLLLKSSLAIIVNVCYDY